jgi:transcriptional regulator with XRE-family HTH domain
VTLDTEQLARDWIRALRGKRSQPALSRRLGYRSNVLYAWEAGRRWPTAATLFELLRRLRFDLRQKLAQFFASAPPWLDSVDLTRADGVAALLNELRGKVPVVELARRSGFSRYAIARWLSADAEPRLPDFLRLFEAASLRLLDFIALFVEPVRLPSAATAWRALEAQRRAAYELPWVPAILHALELSDYRKLERHESCWIARRLQIPLEEEQRCLQLLEHSGQIRRVRGRYEPARELTIDTRPDPSGERKLKQRWAEIGVERLAAGSSDLFSFNVFAVSARDLERLRELHRSYFRQLRSIVANSTPSEHVVVANVQLFALDTPLPSAGDIVRTSP